MIDTIPISSTVPYEFTTDKETVLDAFKERIGVNYDATVDNCIKALYENTRLLPVSEQMRRYIAGVRYEMELKDFHIATATRLRKTFQYKQWQESGNWRFYFRVLTSLKNLCGHTQSSTAPHVLGTVGAITAEVYELKKDQGYTLNDNRTQRYRTGDGRCVTRQNGIRTIVRNADGVAISMK